MHREVSSTLNVPLHRFNEFAPISPSEVPSIKALADPSEAMPRGATIRRQGAKVDSVFLLLDGWVASSIDLRSGHRQIVKVHLPGDVMGVPSMSLIDAAENLITLTPAVISKVSIHQFGSLLVSSPRFAVQMFLSAQRERVALMDTLAKVGRTSAAARMASMVLDLADRLSALGCVRDETLFIPLTQDQVGDVLGLTSIHVNRTFRVLEEQQLIIQNKHEISILDRARLERLADWSPRKLASEFDWLPR